MNKTIYTLLAMLVASIGMPVAADDYLPLVREGVRWHYDFYEQFDDVALQYWECYYEFKGDTIINGNVYKKLYRTVTNGAIDIPGWGAPAIKMAETTTLECCMIEKNKVVYSIYENFYEDEYPETPETLGYKLYDFNQPAESVIATYTIQGVECKSYLVERPSKSYNFHEHFELVEGFGCKFDRNYSVGTLPYPYYPCWMTKAWNFVKFTDTEDNVLFDPYNTVKNGVDGVKVAEAKGDDRYYNLQGQAVDIKTAPAGIYIHGGKKFVVQ